VLLERSSAGEVVSFAVLLLPFGQSSHVSLRGFASGPEIGSESEEVEDQDERYSPLESSASRGDTIALGGAESALGVDVTGALNVVSKKPTEYPLKYSPDRRSHQMRWR
jgi:hypothetical protein